MMATPARLGVLLVAPLVLLQVLERPSHAYVRATTELGLPVWWRSPCVPMDIYLGSPPPHLTADQYWDASRSAARTWSHADVACTGVSISVARSTESAADIGYDHKNVIVFHQDVWCEQSSTTDPTGKTCYSANALAVTTLFKNKNTGEIVDADMEINAVNYAWTDLVADPAQANGSTVDFQNTLTHELGHVLGLAHNCYSTSDGPTPLIDNTGNPEVVCGALGTPAAVADATMYPVVGISDTQRRSLSADDAQAVCDIYPSSQGVCGAPSGGCSVAGPAPAHPVGGWAVDLGCLLALALASLARRRLRRTG